MSSSPHPPTVGHRLRRTLLHLPGGALLASVLAGLLSPGAVLANRDVLVFHLPLRQSFLELWRAGGTGWNPFVHGGQPVLSNPNYAAFYPPTWLGLAVGAAPALAILAVLHAALAYAGAWTLARRLGAGRPAAALAAVGFSGGAFLSLLHSFNLYCGMAWFPWVLAWGDAALTADRGEPWLGRACLAAGALALQLYAGEPVSALLGALALGLLAVTQVRRRPWALARLAAVGLLAALLGSAQLLPTWGRLGDSARTERLDDESAGKWSTRPLRLVEMALPRLWGNPARAEEGYFACHLHDLGHPYVVSLYPGALLLVLGVAALGGRGVPRRGLWLSLAALGVVLALGRHTPAFAAMRALPLVSLVRFPEKFVLLTVASLTFAGALGWERLAGAGGGGRRDRAFARRALAAAGALVVAAGAALALGPGRQRGALMGEACRPSGELLEKASALLAGEAVLTLVTALAALLVVAAARSGRRPRALALVALALLAADLWRVGRRMPRTVAAELIAEPPPLALRLEPGERLFSDLGGAAVERPDPSAGIGLAHLARLDPYSAILWGHGYALDTDFDLMKTAWAVRAREVLEREVAAAPERSFEVMEAWSVGTALLAGEWSPETGVDVRVVRLPGALPRFRMPAEAALHPDWPAARAAAEAERYAVDRREHVVAAGAGGELRRWAGGAIVAARELGDRVEVEYRAAGPALVVVATTFDPGWRAKVDGDELGTWPTALGQIAVEVPAGEHRLVLSYRDPWVAPGVAVTLTTALASAVLVLIRRRGRRRLGRGGSGPEASSGRRPGSPGRGGDGNPPPPSPARSASSARG